MEETQIKQLKGFSKGNHSLERQIETGLPLSGITSVDFSIEKEFKYEKDIDSEGLLEKLRKHIHLGGQTKSLKLK